MYKPKLNLIILDILFFMVSILVFFLTKDYAIDFFFFRYGFPLIVITSIWLITGFFFKKYRALRRKRYYDSAFQTFATALVTLIIVLLCSYFDWIDFSIFQSLVLVWAVLLQNLVVIAFLYMIFYAVYLDEEPRQFDEREPATLIKQAYRLEPEIGRASCRERV